MDFYQSSDSDEDSKGIFFILLESSEEYARGPASLLDGGGWPLGS